MLPRAEQAAIASVLTLSLVLILIYVAISYLRHGGLVDVERAGPAIIRTQIDVNAAEWPAFTLLPNVGEQLARRIVDYRNQHGPFHRHEDLLKVRGIGPQTLEGIRPYLLPIDEGCTISSE